MQSGIGGLIVINLILSFTLAEHLRGRAHRRADRRRARGARDPHGRRAHACRRSGSSPACVISAAAVAAAIAVSHAIGTARRSDAPARRHRAVGAGAPASAARGGSSSSARGRRRAPRARSSGCRMCASSSRPSTSRGPGAREVGGGVDRDDARAPSARSSLGVRQRLLVRARRVIAAGHHHHDLRLRRRRRASQLTVSRGFAGQPEHVLAAGELDQLRRPVAGDEHGIEPLERGHTRAALRRARRAARGRSAPAVRATSSTPCVAAPGRLRRACARRRASRRASSGRARSRAGCEGSSRGELGDLLVGDRAHRAQRLGDDQVGLELGAARRASSS